MPFDAKCPLCDKPAKYVNVGFPSPSRLYKCECAEFLIDDFGENTVAGYTSEFRRKMSAAAKAISGEYVCVITVSKSADGRVDVSCNPVLRSEALR